MAVAYRSSSTSSANAYITTCNVPVPSGAASGDIAVVGLSMWESGNPTVTAPSGFTLVTTVVNAETKLKVFWKRLTAGDTGNYTFTWTGQQWTDGQAILITGGAASGDPIGSQFASATGSGTSITSISTSSVGQPFLVHLVANESTSTSTPPTNFTEVQDTANNHTNYRIPGTTGTQTASGAALATSTSYAALLLAVEPVSATTRKSDFMSFFM